MKEIRVNQSNPRHPRSIQVKTCFVFLLSLEN